MIDTHCHLSYPDLHCQLDDVLARAREAGVDRMITVGTTAEDARESLLIANAHPQVFATVGFHPHYTGGVGQINKLINELREIARQPRIVALGEMGLDDHYDDPPVDIQQTAFRKQLDLASEPGLAHLPIIIHNRKATDDVLRLIREHGVPGERFVFHCFTGSAEELDAVLAIGAMVSFTGIVTFANASDLAETSDRVPMDRLMVETDSPYLTPEPYRKVRPNEPRYVLEVARFLAERRGVSFEAFQAQVDANAERFFRLPRVG